MRVKGTASRVARSVPPPYLRLFTDPSRPPYLYDGPDLGRCVYPGRGAWLAARRDWELANGISITDWFTELLAETQEAGASLDELNQAFSEYLTEGDDDDGELADPRIG